MTNLLTTVEAARLTGYHRDYIRRLVLTGRVSGRRLGRDWLVDREGLLAYAAEMGRKEVADPLTEHGIVLL